MQYKDFRGEVSLSRLGMGTMRLPREGNQPGAPIDFAKSETIIDKAMASGINYYDTAYVYSGSEEVLGRALAKYPRDSYYLADKFNILAEPDYKAQFTEELRRLGTDRIDFYLLHELRDNFLDQILTRECLGYFEELKRKGTIRYLGFSYHGSPVQFPRVLAAYDWDFVQIQLNYFDWQFGDARALYEALEQTDIPVMVMEPVRGGRLAEMPPALEKRLKDVEPDRSIASWAMRWLMDTEKLAVVLSGMNTLEQMEDNLAVFSEYSPLTAEEKALVEEVCAEYRPLISVACTGCRYCCEECPKQINIPRVLNIYNDIKLDRAWRIDFLKMLDEGRRPEDCLGCGLCKKHCPQGIDVPAYMKELVELEKQ